MLLVIGKTVTLRYPGPTIFDIICNGKAKNAFVRIALLVPKSLPAYRGRSLISCNRSISFIRDTKKKLRLSINKHLFFSIGFNRLADNSFSTVCDTLVPITSITSRSLCNHRSKSLRCRELLERHFLPYLRPRNDARRLSSDTSDRIYVPTLSTNVEWPYCY